MSSGGANSGTAGRSPLRVLYLVHDLNDAAVARRAGMFGQGGAQVQLAGFYRGEASPATIEGFPALALDRSYDARLAARAGAVVRRLAGAGGLARRVGAPDVIVARNLEMLAIAVALRSRFGTKVPIVYECLDIHRLMLDHGLKGGLMRALERRLLKEASLLMVSSPAFIEAYFKPRQAYGGPHLLIENKAMSCNRSPRPQGPPWRIGWFGMLRCARSLGILAKIAARGQGRVEVLIAGRPALTEFTDFHREVAAPGLNFVGAYRPEDLASLYGSAHFAWAIDYFEEGLNSAWLLPNRLYESLAYGAVPIALSNVQTGRWLADRDAGLLVDDPLAELPALLEALDSAAMARLSAAAGAVAPGDVAFGVEDCRELVAALRNLADG